MNKKFNLFHVLAIAIVTVGAIAGTAVLSGFPGVIQFQCGSEGCGGLYDGRPTIEPPISPNDDGVGGCDQSQLPDRLRLLLLRHLQIPL